MVKVRGAPDVAELAPMIMIAAMTSAYSVITVWMAATSVSKSSTS